MDYGKLALNERQQNYVNNLDFKPTDISRAVVYIDKRLDGKVNHKICSIAPVGKIPEGQKGVSVAIVIKMYRESGFNGPIDLYLGKNLLTSSADYYSPINFMATTFITKEEDLSIYCRNSFEVGGIEIMVINAKILGVTVADVDVAAIDNYTAALTVKDNEVRLSISDQLPSLSNYITAGFGYGASVGSLSLSGERLFSVVFSDLFGNMLCTLVRTDGSIHSCTRIDSVEADKLSVAHGTDDQLVLGIIKKGRASVVVLNPPTFEKVFELGLEESASIRFVKSKSVKAVILSKGGKSLIRLAQDELPVSDSIKIKLGWAKG